MSSFEQGGVPTAETSDKSATERENKLNDLWRRGIAIEQEKKAIETEVLEVFSNMSSGDFQRELEEAEKFWTKEVLEFEDSERMMALCKGQGSIEDQLKFNKAKFIKDNFRNKWKAYPKTNQNG